MTWDQIKQSRSSGNIKSSNKSLTWDEIAASRGAKINTAQPEVKSPDFSKMYQQHEKVVNAAATPKPTNPKPQTATEKDLSRAKYLASPDVKLSGSEVQESKQLLNKYRSDMRNVKNNNLDAAYWDKNSTMLKLNNKISPVASFTGNLLDSMGLSKLAKATSGIRENVYKNTPLEKEAQKQANEIKQNGSLFKGSQTQNPAASIAGNLTGELAKTGALYGTVGKAVQSLPALQKIANPVVRNVVGGQLADTAISTPLTILNGISEKKNAKQIGKDVLVDQGINLAGNLIGAKLDDYIGKKTAAKTVLEPKTKEIPKLPEATDGSIKVLTKDFKPDETYNPLLDKTRQSLGLPSVNKELASGKMMNLMRNSQAADTNVNPVKNALEPTTPKTDNYTPIPQKSAVQALGQAEEALPETLNKVVLKTPKGKLNINNTLESLSSKFVDTQTPIANFSKEAKDRTALLASNSRNSNGVIDYIFNDALVNRQGNKIGSSLKEVVNKIPKNQEQDFWDYMMQRHNIDRAREGKNVIANYTSEMSQKAVNAIESSRPEYKNIGDNITQWLDSFTKEWGVNAGTIDETIYSELRNKYKSYVPTQREFSELEKGIPASVKKQFVDVNSPIKKATGSARDINNPIENIMNLVNRTVQSAKYNEVGQSLLSSIRKNSEMLKKYAEEIPAKEGMFSNVDNIVTVMEKGKPVYLKINNKALLDSLKGLPKSAPSIKGLSQGTQAFKSLITQKNPLFAVRNVARDLPTAYVFGSESNPLKFSAEYGKAVKDIATNSEAYQRYRALGGGMSNFFSPSQAEKAAEQLTKKPNVFNKIGNAVETLNNATESAPRLAEFNRILNKTGDIEKALNAANDVTVNFARGGSVTKALDKNGVPYLNAGIQGIDKLRKGFENPKTAISTLAKGGISITAPTVGLYLINKDSKAYKELDNRTKDNYYLIPTKWNGTKPADDTTFIKIPKSRELGVLFGSLFERSINAASGESQPFKGYGNTIATNFAPTNPIENNLLSPIAYNIPSNKDFAGRAIVPQGMVMDGRSKYLQYDEKSSEVSKAIAKYAKQAGADLSPKQLDYLIRSYTGIVGQLGLPATTQGGDPLKAVTTNFTSDPAYSNQTITDFYDNYDKAQQKATDKNLIGKLDPKISTLEEKVKSAYAKASNEMSDLNKIAMRVNSGNVTSDDKKILSGYGINVSLKKDDIQRAIKLKNIEIAKAANERGTKRNEMELDLYNNKTLADKVSKYQTAGINQKTAYSLAQTSFDLNKNGSVTQKEAEQALSKTNLPKDKKAVLWQLQNSSWKSANNPFK
ncbi:MAG: LPD38 domain-containing protein [Bacillota bacterium]|nr:LPD38 domain-containing protein [Bacillota bacterium]